MNRIYKKCTALLLVAMFMLSLSVTASAYYHEGALWNQKSKRYSWGTIIGSLYVYPGADNCLGQCPVP